MNCTQCETKECVTGKDCFEAAEEQLKLYEDERIVKLHRAASAIEARHYCKEPRIREVILFAKELGCRKVGLAFCVGLAEEARMVEEILAKHFEVCSVCYKVSGIRKDKLVLEKTRPDNDEVMCNPVGQAALLSQAETELNIICGLCVGHDALFAAASSAPVTTLIAKDRVLAHNPAGAIYCPYIRRKLRPRPAES